MKRDQYEQAKAFIFSDIERELIWFEQGESTGNFMLALALLCYTEFAGGIKRDCFCRGESKRNFEAFFPDMGPGYAQLMSTVRVYDIFRCGLAHEYYIKGNCTVVIETDNSVGLWHDAQQGRYYFAVKKYYEDFKRAFENLGQSAAFE